HDPVMGLTCRPIRLRKGLAVDTIVGEPRLVLTDRIRQRLGIVVAELPCCLCWDNDESARTHPLGNPHIHVCIEIHLHAEAAHGSVTNGSMNASGLRWRAMCVSISVC